MGSVGQRLTGRGRLLTDLPVRLVDHTEEAAAVDLDIVVEYGASIVELARAVRRNVIAAVEQMTGLEVIEVNIAVNDIHLPDVETADAVPIVATARVE